MTTLKIWNLKDELIYKNDNMDDLLHQYGIDITTDEYQEEFETELLGDIFDEENIQSSESYYELKETTGDYFTSLFFKS